MATTQQRQVAQKRILGSATERAIKHKDIDGRTVIQKPDGIEFFECPKKGLVKLEHLAYIVGEGNPHCDSGAAFYERTYFVHYGVGPGKGKAYVCSYHTFGERCAVCDFISQEARSSNPDKDLLKAMKAKERQLFYVRDMDDPKKQIKLWDYSFHLYGKFLDAYVKQGDNDEYRTFFDPDNGYYVKATFNEESMGGGSSFGKVVAIEMKPRPASVPWKVIDNLPCLDELLIKTPYDDVKRQLYQIDDMPPADEPNDGVPPDDDDVVPPDDAPDEGNPIASDDDVPPDDDAAPANDDDNYVPEGAEDDVIPSDDDVPPDDEDAVPADDETPTMLDEDDPNMGYVKGNRVNVNYYGDDSYVVKITKIENGVASGIAEHPKRGEVCNFEATDIIGIAEEPPKAATKPATTKPTVPAKTPPKAPAKPTTPAKVPTKPAAAPAKKQPPLPNKKPAKK